MLEWASSELRHSLYPLSDFPAGFSFSTANGTYSTGGAMQTTLKLSYPWTSSDPIQECTSFIVTGCAPMKTLQYSVDALEFAEADEC